MIEEIILPVLNKRTCCLHQNITCPDRKDVPHRQTLYIQTFIQTIKELKYWYAEAWFWKLHPCSWNSLRILKYRICDFIKAEISQEQRRKEGSEWVVAVFNVVVAKIDSNSPFPHILLCFRHYWVWNLVAKGSEPSSKLCY